MNKYIGVKEINAKPMTLGEYNKLRGWPNHLCYSNYISWSPKNIFERAYRRADGMSFGLSIEAMKKGYKVARSGWNGKGMYCILVPGSKVNLKPGTPYHNALTNNG